MEPPLMDKYLTNLRRSTSLDSASASSVHLLFANAIEMTTGEFAEESYKLALTLWEIVFKGEPNKLQKPFLESKAKIIHLMMNYQDYTSYLKLIRPLYNNKKLGTQPEWADILITTLQFTRDESGFIHCNSLEVSAFLRNKNYTLEEKRLMIATYVRKGLLYAAPKNFSNIFLRFLGFLAVIGDDHLLLTSKEHLVYEKALRLIAIPPKDQVSDRLHQIEETVLDRSHGNKLSLQNLVSTFMNCSVSTSPQTALLYWKYKAEVLSDSKTEILTPQDLRNAMMALFHQKKYENILNLYAQYPQLHDDDQIEILLKISEQSKDWKLLQKQFEDMYGRGELPLVIHYAVVMNALASISVTTEVDQLYEQLKMRNLAPTSAIFAALIKSRLSVSDLTGAKNRFDEFLQKVHEGTIDSKSVPRIHALVFGAHFQMSNLETAMNALHVVLEEQKETDIRLVDARLLCDMVSFCAATFGTLELDELQKIAGELNLKTESFYFRAISALTKFEQFEQAEDMIYEAHLESLVPFASALITKAQLRNYRIWFKATADRDVRKFIASRVTTIIRRVDAGEISVHHMDELLMDIIEHFVSLNKLKAAQAYFERAKAMEGLNENHFLPFLKYHSASKSYDGYAQILNLYRDMVKLKVAITARTYVYLIKSLLHIDKVNRSGFINSHKLLESIFELHGLSMAEGVAPPRVVNVDIFKSAVPLLKIVSSYVMATSSGENDNMHLVVSFLNQMKTKLGRKISFEFRFAILKEMSQLYYTQGNVTSARSLVENALKELHDVVDHFHSGTPNAVPKLLQLEYRKIIDLKLKLLQSAQSSPQEFRKLAQCATERSIQLSGPQYTVICKKIMRLELTKPVILEILHICEKYLVGGNWIEVKIMRKVQYIYKLFILYLSRSLSQETIESKFRIFNDYYDVRDLQAVKQEMGALQDPLGALSHELWQFKKLVPKERWTPNELFQNLPEFFVPERQISTRNIIEPSLASAVFSAVESYCDGDQLKAFELYDEFPEVMEYLLFFGESRSRITHFRKHIDELNPLVSSTIELRPDRKKRAIEALEHLRIATEHTL